MCMSARKVIGFGLALQETLDNKQSGSGSHGRPTVAENLKAALVVPVMQNSRQRAAVSSRRHVREEVTRLDPAATCQTCLGEEFRRGCDDSLLVVEQPVGVGVGHQNGF
jgi:hypothetical protein